jgi:hypothetical protein
LKRSQLGSTHLILALLLRVDWSGMAMETEGGADAGRRNKDDKLFALTTRVYYLLFP